MKGATMETNMSNKRACALFFLILPLLFVLGTLSGCAGAAATAIEDARQVHDSAEAYVTAVHTARREIRRECWEILMDEVDALRAVGNHAEARARLAANYPSLVTVDAVKALRTDEADLLSEPFGCN